MVFLFKQIAFVNSGLNSPSWTQVKEPSPSRHDTWWCDKSNPNILGNSTREHLTQTYILLHNNQSEPHEQREVQLRNGGSSNRFAIRDVAKYVTDIIWAHRSCSANESQVFHREAKTTIVNCLIEKNQQDKSIEDPRNGNWENYSTICYHFRCGCFDWKWA